MTNFDAIEMLCRHAQEWQSLYICSLGDVSFLKELSTNRWELVQQYYEAWRVEKLKTDSREREIQELKERYDVLYKHYVQAKNELDRLKTSLYIDQKII